MECTLPLPRRGGFKAAGTLQQAADAFRRFCALLPVLAVLFHGGIAEGREGSAPPFVERGHVDAVVVDASSGRMKISGWAGIASPAAGAPVVEIFLGNQLAYAGPYQRFDRPDVATATGRPDWLGSGLRVSFPLPTALPAGRQAVRVDVVSPSGARFALVPVASAAAVDIPAGIGKSGGDLAQVFAIAGAVVLAAILLAFFLFRADPAALGRSRPVAGVVVVAILGAFVLLVAAGTSGTSVRLASESQPIRGLAFERVLGQERAIRSDEWVVQTPWAIGQARHQPAFPVVNGNLGLDGQNMLVIGGTGVPVVHLSSVARPATWGYFLFDLPRGMAWHWWFPVFGLLLVSWAFFSILFPGNWILSLALSALLVASPYMAAWSFNPAYVVMLGNASFCLAYGLLTVRHAGARIAAATALGVALAGFALVLYPASQVPLAYLYALVFAGVIARDRARLDLSGAGLPFLLAGALLAGLILFAWWQDAQEAVAALAGTVYPGQRALVTGGDIAPWSIAKGFVSFATLYGDLRGYSNQSEVASFVYFLGPALGACAWGMGRARKVDAVTLGLAAFLALVLTYQYAGFPTWLAQWSLWGRTTADRADLALGLAGIALVGAALHAGSKEREASPGIRPLDAFAALLAIAWGATIWWALRKAPNQVTGLLGPGLMFATVATAAIGSFLLVRARVAAFLTLALALSLSASLPFNPVVSIADSGAPGTGGTIVPECAPGGRTLVLGSQVPAALMLAAGCPVLNGVFQYPQRTLWSRLDPERRQRAVYNRYHHLLFDPAEIADGKTYMLESPQPDLVRARLDPIRFDFRVLGADYVVAPPGAAAALEKNASLERRRGRSEAWAYFAVLPGAAHGKP